MISKGEVTHDYNNYNRHTILYIDSEIEIKVAFHILHIAGRVKQSMTQIYCAVIQRTCLPEYNFRPLTGLYTLQVGELMENNVVSVVDSAFLSKAVTQTVFPFLLCV